jgi:hypothetical protein
MDDTLYYIYQDETGESIFEYASQIPPPILGERVQLRDLRNIAQLQAADYEVLEVEEHVETGGMVIRITVRLLEEPGRR